MDKDTEFPLLGTRYMYVYDMISEEYIYHDGCYMYFFLVTITLAVVFVVVVVVVCIIVVVSLKQT